MKKKMTVAAFASALLFAASLTGCSSAKSMTCDEFAELSSSKATDAIVSLVRAHDLDPYSNAYGVVSLSQEIDQFCGIAPLTGGPATKNNDRSIDSAVDWSEYGD